MRIKAALKKLLAKRKSAYANVFDGPEGEIVLDDLAQFCRANESTFHENERAHALLEGRREVWLRIREHLDLSDEDLARRRNLSGEAVSEEEE